jgi:hypothetical protein
MRTAHAAATYLGNLRQKRQGEFAELLGAELPGPRLKDLQQRRPGPHLANQVLHADVGDSVQEREALVRVLVKPGLPARRGT